MAEWTCAVKSLVSRAQWPQLAISLSATADRQRPPRARNWKTHNATQSVAQNAATQAHSETERLFGEITTDRINLQLAADAAFPYTEKAYTAIRTEFGLPKNGPYKTV